MFKVIIGKAMTLDFRKAKDLSLAETEKSDNVITKYVAYGEGFAFLSTGKPGSAILFSSSKLEAKCRSLTFFFSDNGMTG